MPQFDFYSFLVMIFWLILGIVVFYLVYLKLVLKNTAEVIKMRQKIKSRINELEVPNKVSMLYDTVMKFFK